MPDDGSDVVDVEDIPLHPGWLDFEDVWDFLYDLYREVVDAVNWVASIFRSWMEWVVASVKGLIDGLWTQANWIQKSLSSYINSVWELVNWVYDSLNKKISDILDKISSLSWPDVSGFLKEIKDKVFNLPNTIWDSLNNVVGWFNKKTINKIEGVRNLLDGLSSDFNSGMALLPGQLGTTIDEKVGEPIRKLGDALTGIPDAIKEGVAGVWNPIINLLDPWFDRLYDRTKARVKDEIQKFSGHMYFTRDTIKPAFDDIIVELVDEMVESVTAGSPDPKIAEPMTKLITSMQSRIIDMGKKPHKSPAELKDLMREAIEFTVSFMALSGTVEVLGAAFDFAHPVKQLQVREIAKSLADMFDPKSVIGPMMFAPIMLGILIPLRYEYNRMFTPEIPGVSDLTRFRDWGLITESGYTDNVMRHGYSERWSDDYYGSHWTVPGVGDLNQMFWRGLIDESTFKTYVQRQAYPPGFEDHYAKLSELIPGPQDLVRFVVREYFTFGKGTGSPAEFAEWMKKQGYSAAWAEAYWWSHWELPPIRTLYDAFHRGIINETEVKEYLKWHDYYPDARPGISKSDIDIVLGTTYNLIPRVDLRRAFDHGLLTQSEIQAYYRKLGYTEDDAGILTKITVEWVLTEERNKVRNEYLAEFTEGFITEATLRVKLKELGLPEAVAAPLVLYAKRRQERNRVKAYISVYAAGFRKGTLEEKALTDYLVKLGIEPWRVKAIVDYNKAMKSLEVEAVEGGELFGA